MNKKLGLLSGEIMSRKKFTTLSFIVVLVLVLALLPAGHTVLATTYTVTNTGDSGAGSLRQAIIDVNANPGADTIDFNIPGCGGVCTIQPTSALPTLADGSTTIDGYTQTGALTATDTTSATLMIEIDGTSAGGFVTGLVIASTNNVIQGLVINRFGGEGISIEGNTATGNIISGNYIGVSSDGLTGQGNTYVGISIDLGADNNTVGGDIPAERNVIGGNNNGIEIAGVGTTSNTVSGNYIGIAADGTGTLGNNGGGVYINYAANTLIGGDTEGERNVISNNQNGISTWNSDRLVISGNYIGTDASGTLDRGNGIYGVAISGNTHNTIIGGDTPGERNVISGNDDTGIRIRGSGTTVTGNYIGTDKDGTAALGNGTQGIVVEFSSAHNTIIGGDTPGERNVISGNGYQGVAIGSYPVDIIISGNYIGTDKDGTQDLGNAWDGIKLGGAENTTVGGDTDGERNVISGNDRSGILIGGVSMTATISGNYIGVAANGVNSLGNTNHGIFMESYAQNYSIGPGNVIAHNGSDGVNVKGSNAYGNLVTQNSIFSNTMGIDLVSGANGGITAPVIVTTTLGSVNVVGTACAGCTVEVFENSDTDGEGETYVGDTTATASGAFTVTVSSLNNPYLTATATDAISGTSEFSEMFTATATSCITLTSVSITGPTEGYTDTLYAFTADVTPPDATPTITYTWTPTPAAGSGAVVTYTWATTGAKTITITAENCGGAVKVVSDPHTIIIEARQQHIYLPLVLRNFP